MLFNSYPFWLFFAVVIVLYRALPHRGQNYMLLAASWLFYGWWDWRFLFLLIGTSLMDYGVGLGIGSARTQRGRFGYLMISIVGNLGLLGFFKYAGFFAHELNAALASLGVQASVPVLNVILPVGISFYTFQELSYTVDLYRRETKPVKFLPDFLLYVAFFPQLMAGPIERSSRLIPQVLSPRRSLPGDFSAGMYLVLTGLFYKVILGDNMAGIANAIFQTPTDKLTGAECLMGVYAFAFQIYGDFSGYSAIARGIARWMGFDLMANFRHPYFALSPSDFWRRWHISLSTWLRDYLYIPLGGNRGSTARTYFNLIVTMLIGGFWHGAAWTFIAWGAFHGVLLCVYRPIERYIAKPIVPRDVPPAPHPSGSVREDARLAPRDVLDEEHVIPITHTLKRVVRNAVFGLIMFHLVCIGWLFFRAQSMTQVWDFLVRIFTDFSMTNHAAFALGSILFYAGPMMLYEYVVDRRGDAMAVSRGHWLPRGLVYAYCVVMLWVFVPEKTHAFIYFQF